MKQIKDFENKKIKCDEMNLFCGGSECCNEVQTYDNCGDTQRTWYNEDGTTCCREKEEICCPT